MAFIGSVALVIAEPTITCSTLPCSCSFCAVFKSIPPAIAKRLIVGKRSLNCLTIATASNQSFRSIE